MKLHIALCLMILVISTTLCAQQRDCCWCQAGNLKYGMDVPAGFGEFQCRIACDSNGGVEVGFTNGACYGPPSGPSQPNDCPLQTVGGDCKGNNWCQCHALSVSLSKKELNLGDTVTVSVSAGDLGSGKPLVDPGGGSVDWNDGETSPFPRLGDGSYAHTYAKPGTYSLTIKETGQFKWNADDGSCSFYCNAERHDSIVVSKILTVEEITALLEADKSAQAKKDLAQQHEILQTMKTKKMKGKHLNGKK